MPTFYCRRRPRGSLPGRVSAEIVCASRAALALIVFRATRPLPPAVVLAEAAGGLQERAAEPVGIVRGEEADDVGDVVGLTGAA
jgi:hypothetical protein